VRKNGQEPTKLNPRGAGAPKRLARNVNGVLLYLYDEHIDAIVAHEPEPGMMGMSSSARALLDELLKKEVKADEKRA